MFRCEFVPFQVRDKPSVTVNDGGVERVIHQSFLRKEIDSEQVASTLNIGSRTRQEVPGVRICLPYLRILREGFSRIVGGIEGHSHENQFLVELISKVQTESYFRLGLLDLDSKNLDSAAKNFFHVLERNPKHAGSLAALGRVRFEQKAYAEAVDFLQRAVAGDAGLREAHYYLGLTYARMGRKQVSDEQLRIATRLEHEETEKQRTMLRIPDSGSGDGTGSTEK